MAAAFFWYPGGTALQVLTLSRRIGVLRHSPLRAQTRIGRQDGGQVLVEFSAVERVSLRVNGLGVSEFRQLVGLRDHLSRGGVVGFTSDKAKAVAGFCTSDAAPGATFFPCFLLPWENWRQAQDPDSSLSAGDPIALETLPAYGRTQEIVTVSSANLDPHAYQIVTSAAAFDYRARGPVMVRYAEFWPALRASEQQLQDFADALSSVRDARLTWSIDLDLTTAEDLLDAGANGTVYPGTNNDGGVPGYTPGSFDSGPDGSDTGVTVGQ